MRKKKEFATLLHMQRGFKQDNLVCDSVDNIILRRGNLSTMLSASLASQLSSHVK